MHTPVGGASTVPLAHHTYPMPHLPRIPSRRATRRPSYAVEEEHLSRMHISPPRPAQLPAIPRHHTPRVSVHGAGHTPQPHAHLPTPPHTATRDTTCHTPRVSVHGAGHTPRPHAHLPTAPHTATRDTTAPQATRIGAWRRPRASTARSRLGRPCAHPEAALCDRTTGRAAAERDTANRGLGAVRAVTESRPQVHIYMVTPARLQGRGRLVLEGRLHTASHLPSRRAAASPNPYRLLSGKRKKVYVSLVSNLREIRSCILAARVGKSPIVR